MMHIVLLKATTLFYLVGSFLYLYFVFTLNERSARIGRMFLLVGVIVHGVAFVALYFAAGYTPITSARIFGRIRVGSNVQIGANSVVHADIPDDADVVLDPGFSIRSFSGKGAG